MRHPFLRLLFLALALASTSAAQESSPRKAGLQVRALMLANGIPNLELSTQVGDKVTPPILISTRGLSDPFTPAAKTFALVSKNPQAETGFSPVATVILPEAGMDFILLLEPVGPSQLKAHVVDSKNTSFGKDSVLFFNASDVPVGAELGDKRALLPVGQITLMQAPAKKGDVPYYQVSLYQPEDGGKRKFSTTRWPHRSQGRNYVFIYRDVNTTRLTYRGIDEPMPIDP